MGYEKAISISATQAASASDSTAMTFGSRPASAWISQR